MGFDRWAPSWKDRNWGKMGSFNYPANFALAEQLLVAKGYKYRRGEFKPVSDDYIPRVIPWDSPKATEPGAGDESPVNDAPSPKQRYRFFHKTAKFLRSPWRSY